MRVESPKYPPPRPGCKLPTHQLAYMSHCRPTACRRCGQALAGDDPAPLVHQVAELPKIEPLVDEYRLHRLACPNCGVTTCGRLPEGVSPGCFGPYLQAVLATLAGGYRLSKRQVQQMAGDLFGLSIATGMVSRLERQSTTVLEAPYHEVALGRPRRRGGRHRRHLVAREAPQGSVVGGPDRDDDGLHHRGQTIRRGGQGAAGEQAEPGGYQRPTQLVRVDRSGVATDLLVALGAGFLSHDRSWGPWGSYRGDSCLAWPSGCFAGGTASAMGPLIVRGSRRLHARLRCAVKAALESGQSCGCAKTAATCFEILKSKKVCGPACVSSGSSRRTTGRNVRCDMP